MKVMFSAVLYMVKRQVRRGMNMIVPPWNGFQAEGRGQELPILVLSLLAEHWVRPYNFVAAKKLP